MSACIRDVKTMGVIHHREKSFAIYVPPKCGTWLFDAFVDYPEYNGRFYIDNSHDMLPREKGYFIVRNHYDRILSTYYEKIVDPKSIDNPPGWRARRLDGPGKEYGTPELYTSFYAYVTNLGTHSWDGHIRPYFSFPWFSQAWYHVINRPDSMVNLTSNLTGAHGDINELFLGLPRSTGREMWEHIKATTLHHKMSYSHFLPEPTEYGAPTWEQVHWSQLYQCYLDNGALPSSQLMYSASSSVWSMSAPLIANQVCYRLDAKEIYTRSALKVLLGENE